MNVLIRIEKQIKIIYIEINYITMYIIISWQRGRKLLSHLTITYMQNIFALNAFRLN